MKKNFKKIFALFLAIVMVMTTLVAVPSFASAAEDPVKVEGSGIDIWADPQGVLSQNAITNFNAGNKLASLGGIKPYKRSSSSGSSTIIGGGTAANYYLFLPSNADLSALKFWFEGTASIDGKELTSGEPTDALAEINEGGVAKKYTFTLGSNSYDVTALKSGDVGTIYIDTQSGSLATINGSEDKSAWESGTIMVVKPDGSVDYNGIMDKMSGRGNGTWSTDLKKPYNIKLNKSTSLLGMAAAKKWCLLANAVDGSLIKDQLTYDFADYIGIKYQPHSKPVDLFVNGQYLGAYNLAEKVEIKSNRLNISNAYDSLEIANGTVDETTGATIPADFSNVSVNTANAPQISKYTGHTVGAYRYSTLKDPSDYTGGYLYELEISNRWVTENAGFCGYNRQGWVLKSCDYASQNMVKYSYDLLYALGSSVYNGGVVPNKSTTTNCSGLSNLTLGYGTKSITNPAPATQYQGKKWSDLLDADSAVIYYWTQEFFKNMDSSVSSTYFYKDSDSVDSKLYAGPMWDMDNSLGADRTGSRWGQSWTSSDGWFTKNSRIYRWRCDDSSTSYSKDTESPLSFYGALASNCTDFWQMAEKSWYTTITPAVDVLLGKKVDKSGKLLSIDEYVDKVAKSGYMNNLRYNINSDNYDADNYKTIFNNWVSERQTWINSQIEKTDISGANVGVINNQIYTGNELKPEPSVELFVTGQGSNTLEKGVDYTLSYENNVDVGTASVTVTGTGIYTGSVTKTFKIIPAEINSTYTVSISDTAYKNTELKADIKNNLTGKSLDSSITYQWNKDGAPIDGATSSTYVTTENDAGSTITLTITGDGVNATGSSTSNGCTILAGEKPETMTKSIASWDYDFTADEAGLVGDATDNSYLANGGLNKSTSKLYASVNAKDNAKIKWSGTADLYKNNSTSLASDQSPIMGTSKADALAWGEYPYFETVISTAGYENIKFSAKLGTTKKGPSNWKLQYSLDGATYTDIPNSDYAITANKTMEQAFDNVSLPDACNNQKSVYIRMVVSKDIAFNGVNTIVGQVSGDASVNNIKITGNSLSVITSLYEPTVTVTDNGVVYNDNSVTITDNNGGADIYYTINDGEPTLYSGDFNPFNAKTAKLGDTAVIKAWASFSDIKSETVTKTVTFGGTNINSFTYDTYSKDVLLGAVASSGGTYGQSGKMTAYADGKSQYVPLWNDKNKSFTVAPDDGLTWSEDSGFTYKVTTAGFDNINFSCKAYTTNQGPNSITLQYSLNGETYYNVKSNVTLPANGVLEEVFLNAVLPEACSNQKVVYIRLAATENLSHSGDKLHSNASKGNLYVNNVVVAGDDNGDYKMPYTNKSTAFFGAKGVINYVSPDNAEMKYAVMTNDGTVVLSGAYPQSGIKLSDAKGFDKGKQEPYNVAVWVEDDEDTSLVNSQTYYYKGDSIVEFNYNSTTRPFNNYVQMNSTAVVNTSGATGLMMMIPNGKVTLSGTTLSYSGTYGVKSSYLDTNKFTSTKKLDVPNGNGYWLFSVSTAGYKNLTLSLEQLSSNKGPRDWGLAYSTDLRNFTYIPNSNVRAISNDASDSTVETYSNFVLPDECNNKDTLYILVFINGGETVDGTELDDATLNKGNTGLNKFEICGTPLEVSYTINTTVLENKNMTSGRVSWGNVDIYVDGIKKATSDSNGSATLSLSPNSTYTLTFKGNGALERSVTVTTDSTNGSLNVPLIVFDVDNNGIVNAKDYSIVNKSSKYSKIDHYFVNFINAESKTFEYK